MILVLGKKEINFSSQTTFLIRYLYKEKTEMKWLYFMEQLWIMDRHMVPGKLFWAEEEYFLVQEAKQ